jgi:hypothetical protein
MKTGDRVFVYSSSRIVKQKGTIMGRIDDDIFSVFVDGEEYFKKKHSDELEPMTKLDKLLAGEENA